MTKEEVKKELKRLFEKNQFKNDISLYLEICNLIDQIDDCQYLCERADDE